MKKQYEEKLKSQENIIKDAHIAKLKSAHDKLHQQMLKKESLFGPTYKHKAHTGYFFGRLKIFCHIKRLVKNIAMT